MWAFRAILAVLLGTTEAFRALGHSRRVDTAMIRARNPFFPDTCDVTPLENDYIPFECDPDLDAAMERPKKMDSESLINIILPAATPIIAFLSYEQIAKTFSRTIEMLGPNSWVVVDGGAYQARIIAPAINGVVVPAIAVLFATLTSTTISSLRDRQVDIRRAINKEAGELRALEYVVEAIPDSLVRRRAREYLMQYTGRLISECNPEMGSGDMVTNPRRGMDSEMNAFLAMLHDEESTLPPYVLQEAFASCSKLRDQRQSRITALQSTFPLLHYVILGLLAFAECTAFLMETNTQSLLFLSALQLKILWSMLTATFVACFAVFLDLRSPFAGSYEILASVDQLYIIRLTLQASAQLDQTKSDSELASKTVNGVNGVEKQSVM